jgi:hypothetical protein
MKFKNAILSVSLLAIILCLSVAVVGPDVSAEDACEPVLRHVVLFKFKDTATPEQVQEVEKAFAELPNKIDVIQDYEWGTNVSPEGHDQGFTHCFFLTFNTEADRDAYLPHPAHKAFGKALGPYLDKVCVVDYWTKN